DGRRGDPRRPSFCVRGRSGVPACRRTGEGRGLRRLLAARRGPGVDPGLLALLRRDRCRSGGQRIEAVAGLGERDDLADRVLPREQRHDPVPAEGDAAMGRGAELERLEQEAELLLRLLLADPHQAEDALMHGRVMDPDGDAADAAATVASVSRDARPSSVVRVPPAWTPSQTRPRTATSQAAPAAASASNSAPSPTPAKGSAP